MSDFILENLEPILEQWSSFASKTAQRKGLESIESRDHAEKMLRSVAADSATVKTIDERSSTSGDTALTQYDGTASNIHAGTGPVADSAIHQIVSQYSILRMSVMMKWLQRIESETDLEDEYMVRFNESVDQALAQSLVSHSHAVENARVHFFGTLGHDLRTHLGAILLSADVLLHRKDTGAEAIKAAKRINTSVKRAADVVEKLLTSANPTAGWRLQ
ncbi:histidine kinase dimerization/phospho-acceptor domain-containing protein [Pseudomonas sp. DWP3-1-2]|uniref:histidine kinase dimerization/phospho-acceptor domain-containing protein n=1 Tax=Pseudomonas sp. DWP3-1-2 TaxID=2804645 RepID=UPI003CF1522C